MSKKVIIRPIKDLSSSTGAEKMNAYTRAKKKDPVKSFQNTGQNREIYNAQELCNLASDEVSFLMEPIIPSVGIAFLTGGSDSNKSTFLRQLGKSISSGEENFLGFKLKVKHKRVLIIITEDDKENIGVYLKKSFGDFRKRKEATQIHFLFTASNVERKISEFLSKNPVDAVILDTWTDTYAGDLNTSNKVRENLMIYRRLIQKFPCAVICLHHTGKRAEEKHPSKNSMLGSQGIEATARAVMELRKLEGNKRGLTVLKGNFTPDIFKDNMFILELDTETFTLTNTTEIVELKSGGYGFKNIPKEKFPNKDEIIARMLLLKDIEGKSFEELKEILKTEFGENKVPQKTQLKTWYHEKKGGRPDDNYSDEPTDQK